MIKTNRTISILLTFLTIIFLLIVGSFYTVTNVYADTNYYSAEQYTKDDGLLLSDGTSSNIKDIKDFATEVKVAANDTAFPELSQVIPLQYLESKEQNAEFAYNGKEYGFYMVKEGEYFDLLLIDFVYEFDDPNHTDLEHKIRIKPLLQQSFVRETTEDGSYIWKKYGGVRYTYYVANPRFLTSVRNENALNYGDEGYSKVEDDGVIIIQSRANYGKVEYKTEEDFYEACVNFAADQILSAAVDVLDDATGGIIGIMSDLLTFTADIYESGQETTVRADNEENIFTLQSKSQQLNSSIGGFSRVAGFDPQTELILSDANDSYAEFITVLNDTNYRARLNQYCDFDIVRRVGNYDSMEPVNDKNIECYSFSKERILFEDQQPQFAFDSQEIDGATVPVYMLSYGEQSVNFSPVYSGVYNFTYPHFVKLSVDGEYGNSFYLNGGGNYTIKLENTVGSSTIGLLQCVIPKKELPQTLTVQGKQTNIIKYVPNENGFQRININTDSCSVTLLDQDFEPIETSENRNLFYNFLQGQEYYLCVENQAAASVDVTIDVNPINEIALGQEYTVSDEDKVLCFTNDYSFAEQYQLIFENKGQRNARVVDAAGNSIAVLSVEGTKSIYTFGLGKGEKCYIIFSHGDDSIQAKVQVDPTLCSWTVNEQAVAGKTIRLKPGTTNEIEFYINGTLLGSDNTFHVYTNCDNYNFAGGTLTIGENVSDGVTITIVPDISAGSGLIVTVDDFMTNVYLKHCNGTDDFDTIKVAYGDVLPGGIETPTREGYRFLGYFSEEENGTQYYDEEMNGLNWDIESEEITLYAHWERETYTIYLMEGNSVYDTIQVQYGGIVNYTRVREHYKLIGIYSGQNKTGTRYVHSELKYELLDYNTNLYGYRLAYISDNQTWDEPNDGVLYIVWEQYTMTYSVPKIGLDKEGKLLTSLGSFNLKITSGKSITLSAPSEEPDYTFSHWDINGYPEEKSELKYTFTLHICGDGNVGIKGSQYDFMHGSVTAYYTINDSCVAAGTLITLANGTQVPVEQLTGNESLLVWNL